MPGNQANPCNCIPILMDESGHIFLITTYSGGIGLTPDNEHDAKI